MKATGKNTVCAVVFTAVTVLCCGVSFACPGSDKDVDDHTAFLTPARVEHMKTPARTLNRPVTMNPGLLRQAVPVCPKGYEYYPRTKECLRIPK